MFLVNNKDSGLLYVSIIFSLFSKYEIKIPRHAFGYGVEDLNSKCRST